LVKFVVTVKHTFTSVGYKQRRHQGTSSVFTGSAYLNRHLNDGASPLSQTLCHTAVFKSWKLTSGVPRLPPPRGVSDGAACHSRYYALRETRTKTEGAEDSLSVLSVSSDYAAAQLRVRRWWISYSLWWGLSLSGLDWTVSFHCHLCSQTSRLIKVIWGRPWLAELLYRGL